MIISPVTTALGLIDPDKNLATCVGCAVNLKRPIVRTFSRRHVIVIRQIILKRFFADEGMKHGVKQITIPVLIEG